MPAIGGADKDAVALADIDEVELEERLAAEVGDIDLSPTTARHAGNGTALRDCAFNANAVAPEEFDFCWGAIDCCLKWCGVGADE